MNFRQVLRVCLIMGLMTCALEGIRADQLASRSKKPSWLIPPKESTWWVMRGAWQAFKNPDRGPAVLRQTENFGGLRFPGGGDEILDLQKVNIQSTVTNLARVKMSIKFGPRGKSFYHAAGFYIQLRPDFYTFMIGTFKRKENYFFFFEKIFERDLAIAKYYGKKMGEDPRSWFILDQNESKIDFSWQETYSINAEISASEGASFSVNGKTVFRDPGWKPIAKNATIFGLIGGWHEFEVSSLELENAKGEPLKRPARNPNKLTIIWMMDHREIPVTGRLP